MNNKLLKPLYTEKIFELCNIYVKNGTVIKNRNGVKLDKVKYEFLDLNNIVSENENKISIYCRDEDKAKLYKEIKESLPKRMSYNIIITISHNHRITHCKNCDKHLGAYYRFAHKSLYNFQGKRMLGYCQECGEEIIKMNEQYLLEEYKGNKIYSQNDNFTIGWGNGYYYKTLEECKKDIDQRLKGIIPKMPWFHIPKE